MKTRASLYAPDRVPDISSLTARYSRLIFALNALILIGDYSGVLKTSRDIARAAKALIKSRAKAAAIELKFQMLACPSWRVRVLADLGGQRKLALWIAAMQRAVARKRIRPAPPHPKPTCVNSPATHAARQAEIDRCAHIRDCARACAHPLVLKDPFRVDQDGLFRLPPLPRVSAGGRKPARREYTYDPRKFRRLSGARAPAVVWPIEFYAAERGLWGRKTVKVDMQPSERDDIYSSSAPAADTPVFAPP